MNNNDNKQQSVGSSIGNAVGGAAKMGMKQLGALIKKKLLLLLAPAMPYILLGFFLFFAILIVFYNFNSMFSLATGKDPYLSEENDGIYEDLNENEKIPGQEEADDFLDSYENPGSGLEYLKGCDANLSLWQWVDRFFTGDFQNTCDMINYIKKTANDLEDKFNMSEGELDRGLVVSTLLYAYVYRDSDIDGEPGPDDPNLSSGDPLTILNHMIENEDVKITREDIDLMFERQVLAKKYVKLTWGVVREEIVYKAGTDEIDYINKYYGCTSTIQKGHELDFDKYKIFLRDDRETILGKDESILNKNWITKIVGTFGGPKVEVDVRAVEPYMEINGYIGARNFYYTVSESTSFCVAGEPNLDPANHEYLETSNGANYVTMGVSQAFIKNIVDNKLHDYQVFLKKADYEKLDKDNLSFTYNGSALEIKYSEGFLNDEFSYMKYEKNEIFKPKKGEKIIDVIFSNAAHMNDALNFVHSNVDDTVANTSIAVVVGDEANPLGDFPYVITSPYGWRGAIEGTTHTGSNFHGAIDMAGAGINGSGVYAWKDGTVTKAGFDYNTGCGNFVRISHESLDGKTVSSLYCHMLKTPLVKAGDKVTAGTQLGQVGSTGNSSGPHLHFAISINGKNVDPCPYIKVGRTCAEAGA